MVLFFIPIPIFSRRRRRGPAATYRKAADGSLQLVRAPKVESPTPPNCLCLATSFFCIISISLIIVIIDFGGFISYQQTETAQCQVTDIQQSNNCGYEYTFELVQKYQTSSCLSTVTTTDNECGSDSQPKYNQNEMISCWFNPVSCDIDILYPHQSLHQHTAFIVFAITFFIFFSTAIYLIQGARKTKTCSLCWPKYSNPKHGCLISHQRWVNGGGNKQYNNDELGLFVNGVYNGFYTNGWYITPKQQLQFDLQFNDQDFTVSGSGSDENGEYSLIGKYNAKTLRIALCKQYIAPFQESMTEIRLKYITENSGFIGAWRGFLPSDQRVGSGYIGFNVESTSQINQEEEVAAIDVDEEKQQEPVEDGGNYLELQEKDDHQQIA